MTGFVCCVESRNGYDKHGRDKCGYDQNGFDASGYDKEGYDKFGYDKLGYDKVCAPLLKGCICSAYAPVAVQSDMV